MIVESGATHAVVRTESRAGDIALRVLVAASLAVFIWRAWNRYEHTGSVVYLLELVAQTLTTILILIARSPKHRAVSPLAITTAAFGTWYFLFIDLNNGFALAGAAITIPLQLAGIALQIYAKATLGRSFGLLPGDRGVVTKGPYRIVRHPIYLSYFLADLGFVLGAFSVYNLCLYVLLYAVQIIRMGLEEKVLVNDPVYRAYEQRVRWRFIPFIY